MSVPPDLLDVNLVRRPLSCPSLWPGVDDATYHPVAETGVSLAHGRRRQTKESPGTIASRSRTLNLRMCDSPRPARAGGSLRRSLSKGTGERRSQSRGS